MSNPIATPGSCTACGACCYGDGPRYIRVSGADYERLGEAASRVTQFLGNRCYMILAGRRCAALSHDVEAHTCACTIYAVRPEACRCLERGSPECSAVIERERHRASPLEPATSDAGPPPRPGD